jgi:anti-sigma factor NepR-like protein
MDDNNKPTGPRGPMAGSAMQGSTPHKRKHSLNRETQLKLGNQLQNMYNAYLNEGTPDRHRELIRQLESGKVPGFPGSSPYEGLKDASENKGS